MREDAVDNRIARLPTPGSGYLRNPTPGNNGARQPPAPGPVRSNDRRARRGRSVSAGPSWQVGARRYNRFIVIVSFSLVTIALLIAYAEVMGGHQ